MTRRIACALGLALVLAPVRAWASQPEFAHPADDLPLLTSAQQVFDARVHGAVSFRIGGELYHVRGLPDSYVRYSVRHLSIYDDSISGYIHHV